MNKNDGDRRKNDRTISVYDPKNASSGSITVAIKNTKAVIPAKAGISSIPDQGLQEDPGFRRDDVGVGLFNCRSNNIAVTVNVNIDIAKILCAVAFIIALLM